MTRYISILRGINVSGQKIIKMDALKKVYENLNFENIQTYVQSGNVVFSAKEMDSRELENRISSKLEMEFGFFVPVIILSLNEMKMVIENNPFANDKDITFLHVTFLANPIAHFNKEVIIEKKHAEEEIFLTPSAVYLYCPNGYGKTKLNNNFLENKLNVTATTRNWKTVKQLIKLAKSSYEV